MGHRVHAPTNAQPPPNAPPPPAEGCADLVGQLGSVLKPQNEEGIVVPQEWLGDGSFLMLNQRFQWWGPLKQRLLKKFVS
jgi:hypothetical protein